MTSDECIHGLPIGECEVCSPREIPATGARLSAPAVRAKRAPARAAGAPRPGTSSSGAPGVAVRAVDARRYLVLDIEELGNVLAGGPLGESEGWRLELGAETTRDRVVIVSTLSDPDALQLLGVANEPARRQVSEVLRDTGRVARVVVNPAWFA